MKLSGCGCSHSKLKRIDRPLWMRFLPFTMLYRCKSCGVKCIKFFPP